MCGWYNSFAYLQVISGVIYTPQPSPVCVASSVLHSLPVYLSRQRTGRYTHSCSLHIVSWWCRLPVLRTEYTTSGVRNWPWEVRLKICFIGFCTPNYWYTNSVAVRTEKPNCFAFYIAPSSLGHSVFIHTCKKPTFTHSVPVLVTHWVYLLVLSYCTYKILIYTTQFTFFTTFYLAELLYFYS